MLPVREIENRIKKPVDCNEIEAAVRDVIQVKVNSK
jgi:hypothetical protein